MSHISFDDFLKVEMRVGRVTRVEDFPKARVPAFKLWIDFGPELGEKKTSAQITDHYSKEDLLERLVVAVVNFPPKQVADFMSEVLILGAINPDQSVVLLHPGQDVAPGLRIA